MQANRKLLGGRTSLQDASGDARNKLSMDKVPNNCGKLAIFVMFYTYLRSQPVPLGGVASGLGVNRSDQPAWLVVSQRCSAARLPSCTMNTSLSDAGGIGKQLNRLLFTPVSSAPPLWCSPRSRSHLNFHDEVRSLHLCRRPGRSRRVRRRRDTHRALRQPVSSVLSFIMFPEWVFNYVYSCGFGTVSG